MGGCCVSDYDPGFDFCKDNDEVLQKLKEDYQNIKEDRDSLSEFLRNPDPNQRPVRLLTSDSTIEDAKRLLNSHEIALKYWEVFINAFQKAKNKVDIKASREYGGKIRMNALRVITEREPSEIQRYTERMSDAIDDFKIKYLKEKI